MFKIIILLLILIECFLGYILYCVINKKEVDWYIGMGIYFYVGYKEKKTIIRFYSVDV